MATEYLNNKTFEKIILRFQAAKRHRTRYALLVEDIREAERRTAARRTYVKPPAWVAALAAAGVADAEYATAQNELAVAFYTLSANIVRYARFHLIDEDDAVQEGVVICFEKIDRFDPRKGKAFNYMTTCIFNHFRQLYRTARNYNDFKRRYHDHVAN